jgi:hypothetical protein
MGEAVDAWMKLDYGEGFLFSLWIIWTVSLDDEI